MNIPEKKFLNESHDLNEKNTYFHVQHEFYKFYEKLDGFSKLIVENFLHRFKDPSEKNIAEDEKISAYDVVYSPLNISDNDLKILHAFLWYNPLFVNHGEVTPDWFVRLNYILNQAIFHCKKYHSISIGDEFSYRMTGDQFSLKEKDDYLSLLAFLSSKYHLEFHDGKPQKNEKNSWNTTHYVFSQQKKKLTTLLRHCIFLKILYIVSHLENNPVFRDRVWIFNEIIHKIFSPLFGEKLSIDIESNEAEIHNNVSVFHKGNIHLDEEENHNITFWWRVKQTRSAHSKLLRDRSYSNSEAMNDTFAFTFECENHKELLSILAFFADHIEKHSLYHQELAQDSNDRRETQVKDKGIIITDNEYRNQNIDLLLHDENIDLKIKEKINRIFQKKSLDKKNHSGKDYVDIKFLIPLDVRWCRFKIELKFVIKWNKNEFGLSHHSIFDLDKIIKQEFRKCKFLTISYVEKLIDKTIKENWVLIEQIGNWDKELTKQLIFDDLLTTKKTIAEKVFVDHTQSFLVVPSMVQDMSASNYYPQNLSDKTNI